MRILHRYILREILKALALALVAVTGVVCLGMVLNALQQKGIGPITSMFFMALSAPGAAYLAMPLAAILAGTLVYGRLAADNEVMACRASGIPVSSLFWPAFILAVLASGITLGLAAWPLPASKYAAKKMALEDIERFFFSQLSGAGKIKVKDLNFQMTVDRVVGDMLYGPTLKYRGKNGQTYCYAPYGRVEFDRSKNLAKLALWEAIVIDEAHKIPVRGTHTVTVTLPTHIPREEDNLSLWELMLMQRHPELSDRVRNLDKSTPEAAVEYNKKAVRAKSIAEMHGRMAAALGCFGLVLIGAGLGMYFHSGNLLTAFGVAMVPWLVSTILSMTAVKTVAKNLDHAADRVWVIWLPNILVVVLGLAILGGLVWFWNHPVRLRHRLWRWGR